MVRMSLIAVAASILFAAGCQDTTRRDHAHLLVDPVSMEAVEAGFLLPGAGEADYVERAAATRAAYREALASLAAYYRSVGNYTKGQWAQTELRTWLRRKWLLRIFRRGILLTGRRSCTSKDVGCIARGAAD